MNAITLLKTDHKNVEALFKEFESLEGSRGKKRIANEIIKELSKHAAIEEQIMYPTARRMLEQNGEEDDLVLEALEEHHVVKWTLSEIEKLDPDAERYDAKMKVLMEMVRHHVKEEEGELFPKLRQLLEPRQLNELGAMMEKAKRLAPSRPHPRQPDTPPGNLAAGLGAGMLDKARDAARTMRSNLVNRVARTGASKKGSAGRRTGAKGRSARASAAAR
jgi:hemerythrin superfamily protein